MTVIGVRVKHAVVRVCHLSRTICRSYVGKSYSMASKARPGFSKMKIGSSSGFFFNPENTKGAMPMHATTRYL